MSNDLAFDGFRSWQVGPDDPLSVKWLSMDKGTMRSMAVQKSLASVGEFNISINREIKFDVRESEEMSAWQTPQQTFTKGTGDCKDYALLKYSLLMHKGIDACVVFGEIRRLGMGNLDGNIHHAWCAARINDHWYALDNMFDHLEPVETYLNWTPKAAMHDDSVVRFGREFTMNDELAKHSAG